jgi:DNA-binding NtrC family response regulator
MLRTDHPGFDSDQDARRPRLNLLLSCGGWREQTAVDQLPRLLEPMGIHAVRAASGEEAARLIAVVSIHIAIVDLTIPLRRDAPAGAAGGHRILELLRRLDPNPPTVVVRPPQPAARESVRTLSRALRDGAFAVLDRPVQLEVLLEVMRRILRRHYGDLWPTSS